jgi:hypothetical protein
MAFDGDAVFDEHELDVELDREWRTVGGNVQYTATPLTTVLVSVEESTIRFSHAPIRDTDSRQVLAGVEFNPRALISGSARVGYQRFEPRSSTLPDFGGLVGTASVSYRLSPSTNIGFTFDRRTDFSYLADEPYYLREGYGVLLRRQLVPRWDVEFSVERASHKYRQVQLAQEDTGLGHRERLLRAAAFVGYDVSARTRATFGVTYQDRRSDFTTRRYDGIRAGTSIAYGF